VQEILKAMLIPLSYRCAQVNVCDTLFLSLISIGLNEDAATGSAQCVLAPYYFQKFSMDANATEADITQLRSLTGYQASKRGGVMQIALVSGADSAEDRVVIAGRCVTVMQSTLCIE
jgi:predicted PhzF superfamily epimerase YddE/YHI9